MIKSVYSNHRTCNNIKGFYTQTMDIAKKCFMCYLYHGMVNKNYIVSYSVYMTHDPISKITSKCIYICVGHNLIYKAKTFSVEDFQYQID